MLVVSLKEMDELNQLYTLCDGIVVYTSDFSSFYNKAYNLEEIKEIYSKKKNLRMISEKFDILYHIMEVTALDFCFYTISFLTSLVKYTNLSC